MDAADCLRPLVTLLMRSMVYYAETDGHAFWPLSSVPGCISPSDDVRTCAGAARKYMLPAGLEHTAAGRRKSSSVGQPSRIGLGKKAGHSRLFKAAA